MLQPGRVSVFKKREQTSSIFVFYEEFEHDATTEDVDALHRSRGGLCCGFHYVVLKNGTVETGRDVEEYGWHPPGRNGDSVAVAFIVDPEATPTQVQEDSGILQALKVRYPQASIIYPE